MASRPLWSDAAPEPPPLRKRVDKPPRARLRILIASDPSRPMRAISLPHAVPLVASLVGGALVLLTIALACGSWKLSDGRAVLERRVHAMMQAADSVAMGSSSGSSLGSAWSEGSQQEGRAGTPLAPALRPPGGPLGHFVIQSVNNGEEMQIDLNLNTGEMEPESYRRFRHLMRCLHTSAETPIDPRLIDLLYRIAQRTHQKILLVSGFRAPMYSMATLSYHTRGMAADIRIPGMTALMARDLAESMGVHGLGYYPVSGFIHVDVREDRIRWIDYGHNRQDGEGTEHGPNNAETVAAATPENE